MHIDAVGAAVELRGADLHEMHEGLVETRGDGYRSVEPALHLCRCNSKGVDFGGHGRVPSVGFRHHDEWDVAGVTSRPEFLQRPARQTGRVTAVGLLARRP